MLSAKARNNDLLGDPLSGYKSPARVITDDKTGTRPLINYDEQVSVLNGIANVFFICRNHLILQERIAGIRLGIGKFQSLKAPLN